MTPSRSWALILLLSSGLLTAPLAAEAHPAGRIYRVALVSWANEISDGLFLGSLRDLGYVEGRNLAVERRSCESKNERASEIMAEVVRLKAT